MTTAREQAERYLRGFDEKTMPEYVGINGEIHRTIWGPGSAVVVMEPANFRVPGEPKEHRQTRYRKVWIVAPHFWDDGDDYSVPFPWEEAATRRLQEYVARGVAATKWELRSLIQQGYSYEQVKPNLPITLDRVRLDEVVMEIAAENGMLLIPLVEKGWVSRAYVARLCGIDDAAMRRDLEDKDMGAVALDALSGKYDMDPEGSWDRSPSSNRSHLMIASLCAPQKPQP